MDEKTDTIYAFIDSQNLNLSVQKDIVNDAGATIYNGWKLDFKRFFIYLKDKYKVDKAYLFIGRVVGNESLYKHLESIGYKVIYKPTLDFKDGKERITKGNVDAELVLHAMIEYLEMQKKLSRIIIPNKTSYSSLLRKYSAYFVYVTDLRGKLEYRK